MFVDTLLQLSAVFSFGDSVLGETGVIAGFSWPQAFLKAPGAINRGHFEDRMVGFANQNVSADKKTFTRWLLVSNSEQSFPKVLMIAGGVLTLVHFIPV